MGELICPEESLANHARPRPFTPGQVYGSTLEPSPSPYTAQAS
jgi:hypothetical protein